MTDRPVPADLATALATALAAIACKAGAAILAMPKSAQRPLHKLDGSPVTAADRLSEAVILEELARALPGVPVLAEEEVAAGRLPADASGALLLVDPLDGTREYCAGRSDYAVNVAFVRDGLPVAGAVCAPAFGLVFAGAAGAGAWTDAMDGAPAFPNRAPMAVRKSPAGGLVAMVSASHPDGGTERYLAAQGVVRREPMGSALKFCRLAEGAADLYARFGPTMEWDTAAGHAVLIAAGGRMTTPDGGPFLYGKRESGFRNGPFVATGG